MKFNWGHGILSYIILFLILSTIFIIFSLKQNIDLVSDDYYQKGADFSKQIDINKRSLPYRDSISISDADTTISMHFSKSISDSTDSVQIYFFRPSGKHNDVLIEMPLSNKLDINKQQLINGRYVVTISWRKNNEKYMVDKELYVK